MILVVLTMLLNGNWKASNGFGMWWDVRFCLLAAICGRFLVSIKAYRVDLFFLGSAVYEFGLHDTWKYWMEAQSTWNFPFKLLYLWPPGYGYSRVVYFVLISFSPGDMTHHFITWWVCSNSSLLCFCFHYSCLCLSSSLAIEVFFRERGSLDSFLVWALDRLLGLLLDLVLMLLCIFFLFRPC
jgi:hypothetical protein